MTPVEKIHSFNLWIIDAFQYIPSSFLVPLMVVVGACIGSFLNVVIHRSPQTAIKDEQDYVTESYGVTIQSDKRIPEDYNCTRSYCPSCKKKIPWHLNLPVLSWLLLRGRASCCGASISSVYIASELLMGVAFGALTASVGEMSLTLLALFTVVCTGYVIAMIDLHTKLILDKHASIYVVSFILCAFTITNNSDVLVNALLFFVAAYVAEKAYENTRNFVMRTNLVMMGDGDWALWYTLCVACCAHMSTTGSTAIIFAQAILIVAFVFCSFALYQIASKKNDSTSHYPAAPSIVLASISVLLAALFEIDLPIL